jgi:hypothetical protein
MGVEEDGRYMFGSWGGVGYNELDWELNKIALRLEYGKPEDR